MATIRGYNLVIIDETNKLIVETFDTELARSGLTIKDES